MTLADASPLRVVVTRATRQSAELCERFAEAGAEVATLPLLEVVTGDPEALDHCASRLGCFAWLVFSSSNAVEAFLPRLGELSRVPPGRASSGRVSPRRPKIAVIGPATARAVRRLGYEPALEASRQDGSGLAASLRPHLEQGTPQRVLLPQADDARPELAAGLRGAGVDVETPVAYRKILPKEARTQAKQLFARGTVGWVTLTSPRIVRHFVALDVGGSEAWSRRLAEVRALSIGPTTSAELRRHGLEIAAEAKQPTATSMVEAWLR